MCHAFCVMSPRWPLTFNLLLINRKKMHLVLSWVCCLFIVHLLRDLPASCDLHTTSCNTSVNTTFTTSTTTSIIHCSLLNVTSKLFVSVKREKCAICNLNNNWPADFWQQMSRKLFVQAQWRVVYYCLSEIKLFTL